MRFEWDENKRLSNIEKHGVDFRDVRHVFVSNARLDWASHLGDEPRNLTTAVCHGRLITVVWTWRGETIRIISARRARDGEERAYSQLFR